MTSNKQPNCSSSLTASYMIILTVDLELLNFHRNVIVTLTKYPPLIKCNRLEMYLAMNKDGRIYAETLRKSNKLYNLFCIKPGLHSHIFSFRRYACHYVCTMLCCVASTGVVKQQREVFSTFV